MSFSEEFICDGIRYKLESNCEQALWPKLRSRVQAFLANRGKEAAKQMFGQASVGGYTKLNNVLCKFKLTINPKGNSFNVTI